MGNFKISVVTVSFNAVKEIEDTILSVVDQTYNNIEYIVIDGGSTDGTIDIIKKYAEGGSEADKHHHHITFWVSEPDKGIFDAMNKGIMKASGDFINFMNAGDSFAAKSTISDVFNKNQINGDIIYGDWMVCLNNSEYLRRPLDKKYINRQIPFCHQAAFYNLDYHKKHLFPLNLKLTGDYKIVFDAYHKHKIIFQYIPLLIANYDITLGNSASIDRYNEAINEKYKIWGIENNLLAKLPFEIERGYTWLSYQVRKILPTNIILKIKRFKDKLRCHESN